MPVDVLRYELGVALARQLAEDGRIQLHAAFAQLPSITPVGMASFWPGAGQQRFLQAQHDGLVPRLVDVPVTNVNQRMEIFRKRYGQRFAEMPLYDFVRGKRLVPDTVELLVA